MRSSFAATPLASIAHIEMGQSPDSSTVKEGDHGGVPFLQGNAEFGVTHPAPRFSCTAPMKMCRAGDILMSVRAPVGAMNIADRDYCIGRGLAAVRVTGMSPTLAAHMVSVAAPALRRVAQGTTFEAISKTDLASLVVMAPPEADREPLGRVLDTLDTTIRQTEAIIEKLKQVKQGLLHDLLTRGIDANGELRPPQSQAPHLYKDSPLGWIPREWDICGVLDIAPTDRQCILTGPFGAQLGQGDFVAEGVPVLRIGNVQAGFIDWSDLQFVSHAKAGRLERFSVLPGDLLFARQGATTGRNALADERADGALINYHIIRVAVDRDRCEPVYLHALFNSHQSKGQVDQEKGRGTREGINSKQIASLRFALPQIAEQRMLVAHMAALQVTMDQESLFVAKLRLKKQGLMDDLLTGRVRVTPLLAAATP
jgi:type I restriction enzyme S subunit